MLRTIKPYDLPKPNHVKEGVKFREWSSLEMNTTPREREGGKYPWQLCFFGRCAAPQN
jgi:hypothetical protein